VMYTKSGTNSRDPAQPTPRDARWQRRRKVHASGIKDDTLMRQTVKSDEEEGGRDSICQFSEMFQDVCFFSSSSPK